MKKLTRLVDIVRCMKQNPNEYFLKAKNVTYGDELAFTIEDVNGLTVAVCTKVADKLTWAKYRKVIEFVVNDGIHRYYRLVG